MVGALSTSAFNAAPTTASALAQMPLPLGIQQALSSLDDRLVGVLEKEAIRLVRATWFCQQPPDFKMPMRQELEELEKRGGQPSPLLQADEAVALVRKGNRGVGVLSYPWLSPGDPDPEGRRVQVLQRTLAVRPHLEAFFWE